MVVIYILVFFCLKNFVNFYEEESNMNADDFLLRFVFLAYMFLSILLLYYVYSKVHRVFGIRMLIGKARMGVAQLVLRLQSWYKVQMLAAAA